MEKYDKMSKKEVYSRGSNRFMCKASEVGKIVINKCLDRKLEINTQKLQKLLVLVQVECIKESGFPLFSEDIRIWDCGVAIKEVDEDFRAYSLGFSEDDKQIENLILLHSEHAYIDKILDRYGELSIVELSELPIIQRIVRMGIINEGETVPHISAACLTEEFA